VDLKAFSEDFYWRVTKGHLQPVLETLSYLKRETGVWLEITNLMIPGENDSPAEIEAMTRWIVEHLGPDVPLHFTAFHPDYKMTDKPATPQETLVRSREIARKIGIHHVYLGNVPDAEHASTYCHGCGALTIGRRGYVISDWNLNDDGACSNCGAPLAGVFDGPPGDWGSRRLPVRLRDFAAGKRAARA
jgi:pyruvate formate lyase activating enzyme